MFYTPARWQYHKEFATRATEVPILIRALNQSETELLFKFLLGRGTDHFAVASCSIGRNNCPGCSIQNTGQLLTDFFHAGLLPARPDRVPLVLAPGDQVKTYNLDEVRSVTFGDDCCRSLRR